MNQTGPWPHSQDLTVETIRQLVSGFQTKRILVIGDVMLDEYLIGEVRRISPEAPVPIVDLTHIAHIPGGAANVAANIASLGGSPVLLGLVGEDAAAKSLTNVLAQRGVPGDALVPSSNWETITKTRIVSGQQQIVRLDKETKFPIEDSLLQAVLFAFDSQIAAADVCLLSDYGKGLLTSSICRHIIARACRLQKPVIVDPKGLDFSKYAGCTVITPNVREAEQVCHMAIGSEEDLLHAADRLHALLGNTALLITRGAEGMTLFRREATPLHAPALAREVFDVTGAGDTVVSVLALVLAAQFSLEQAMLLSNRAASIVVQKTGTATVSAEELLHTKAGMPRHSDDSRSYQAVPSFPKPRPTT